MVYTVYCKFIVNKCVKTIFWVYKYTERTRFEEQHDKDKPNTYANTIK